MDARNVTVLVVDDDQIFREALVYELKRKQIKTMDASNGIEALKIVKNEKIHVIVSDVKMPGGDGIELLKEIRKIDSEMPVFILMSGFTDLSSKEAIALGAKKILAKPFDRKLFISEITTIITDLREDS